MIDQVLVSIAWPSMNIRTVDQDTKITDEIVGSLTLRFKTTGVIVSLSVRIGQTPVRRDKTKSTLLPQYWVDACVASGQSLEAEFHNELPRELTKFELRTLGVYAAAMPATEAILVYNNSIYKGSVDYPKCRISNPLGEVQTASPVTATGTLTRQ